MIDDPNAETPKSAGAHARRRPSESHLHQPFDYGRLDNEVEAPKLLIDVIHVGVAAWGAILAAGVYFFGGQDWRESLLVIGVFAFFLVAWRLALFVGARRKTARVRRENGTKAASGARKAEARPPIERSDD